MRLLSIELTNFRQFKKEKVEFATDKNKNVTLVMGDNGSGKTSLAQAFFWCLYGKSTFQDKILLNRFVANNMTPDQNEKVFVRVRLEHEGQQYCIVREQEYTKQYNDSLKPKNAILNISKRDEDGNNKWLGAGKTDIVKNIELANTVNDIMPEDLSKYFFFDGEKIETLSKEISSGKKSSNFVEAVNCLTGLKATRNALEHLHPTKKSSVIGKFNDEYISGSDGKIAQLTKEINDATTSLTNAEKRINEIDDEINKNSEYIDSLKGEMNTYEDARDLQKTKTMQERLRGEHIWKRYEALSNIYEIINRDDIFERFICEEPTKRALEILSQCDVSGKDIPKLHGDTIKYLLKRNKCICDTSLTENLEAREALEKLIKYLPPESISTTIGNFVKSNKNKYLERTTIVKDIEMNYGNMLALEGKIDECSANIDKINKKLNGKDVNKKVNELNGLINQANIAITKLRKEKDNLNQSLGRYDTVRKQKEEERSQLAKKSSQNTRIELCKKYAIELYNIFEKRYDKKEKQTKASLQTYINENFKKFFNGNISLQIDENYAVKVSVNDKFNSLETSTAQGIAVIFAFLAAIIRIAKENNSNENNSAGKESETYPVVMDAPLSTLDNQRIKIVCETLPQIADQVIIFIKDTDGKIAEQYLGDTVGKRLTFNKINDYITEIN